MSYERYFRSSPAATLVASFKGHVVNCIGDLNGNHVIQVASIVLSNHLKDEDARGLDDTDAAKNVTYSLIANSFNIIIDEVIQDLQSLSRHSYGCRVVQRMVEHFDEPYKSRVLDAIIACHTSLFDHVCELAVGYA